MIAGNWAFELHGAHVLHLVGDTYPPRTPQEGDKRHRMAVLQRQTMACVARCFGELRTGDLHALDWSAFDVVQGGFEWGWAPRRKTKRPRLLEVPEMLRGILRDWWERHGRPQSGPVFPARRGKRAGQAKGKVSHAKAFRRDLRRAFGVDGWDVEALEFKATRELTRRERELFEETELMQEGAAWIGVHVAR